MSRLFMIPLFFILVSPSQAELRLGDTVDGLLNGLRPTVNGLLGTVDNVLPLVIRFKRDVDVGQTLDSLTSRVKSPVNGLLSSIDQVIPLGLRKKRDFSRGDRLNVHPFECGRRLSSCDFYLVRIDNVRKIGNTYIDSLTYIRASLPWIYLYKVSMEARIYVTSVHGIKPIINIVFSQPKNMLDNAFLIVEGEKFNYLAAQSEFFYSLFYNDFKEKNECVSNWEISPSRNSRNFFKLSSRRISLLPCSMEKVELYLIKTKKVPIERKLLFADQYKLEQLKMLYLKSFKSAQSMKYIQKTPEFKEFSGPMNQLCCLNDYSHFSSN
ncbi:hypothetical protein PRIPAC_70034 [Pristionchus pacificus]|uniref:Uncharacterized protein n=1 Tax=Pristionchus pacificus TaxID=54126 RepID=A0A2A6C9J1_PRIPA|nr:hypothetical protein PRIPAC_70034 [Pristionchus pacificus]|eukprot:PDM74797.1 hypothetical protein PRIPAC_43210 [Pristionchus pacificus]